MGVPQELTARIVALFLETLLFGAFSVTYTIGAWPLLQMAISGRRTTRDCIILGASTTMFGLAFAHLISSLRLTVLGFISHGGSLESVNDEFQRHSGTPQLGIYVTQTLIGDAFMIYRLFVVGDRSRKLIILPASLCLLGGVSGYIGLKLWQPGVLTPVGFFLFSFVSNVFASGAADAAYILGLIMWRVLRIGSPDVTPLSVRVARYRKVFEAIIQSAAIYSAASISLAITFLFSPNVGFPVCLGVFSPLIGLVFSFIVRRLARKAEDDAPRYTPPMQARAAVPSSPRPVFHISVLDSLGDVQNMGNVDNIKLQGVQLSKNS